MSTAIWPVTPKNRFLAETVRRVRPELAADTAVVPNGWAKACNPEGFRVVHRLAELPEEADTVLVLTGNDRRRQKEAIRELIRQGKQVLCAAKLAAEEQEQIREMGNAAGVRTFFFDNRARLEKVTRRDARFAPLESIVIAAGALTKGIRTTDLVIRLREGLAGQGYKVSVMASDPDLRALGCDYLPAEDLIGKDTDHTVMTINRYLNDHQNREGSDIILMQLPDEGLHRISADYETCFGVLTYLISQAANIDYGVMVAPVLDRDAAVYRALSETAKGRYGFGYDAVFVLPQTVDPMYTPHGAENVDYYTLPEEEREGILSGLRASAGAPGTAEILFPEDSEDGIRELVNHIIDSLS